MVNQLSDLRADISNLLNEAGIHSIDYGEPKIHPPVAVVLPNDDYVTQRSGDTFGQFNVSIRVMLLGPKATASVASNTMDDLIVTALIALGDHFDVVSVSAPGEAQISNVSYFASVIDIDAQIILREEI